MQRDIQECVSLFCSFFSSSILSGNDGLTIGDAAGKKKKRELTENLLGGDCLWIKIYNIFWRLPDAVGLRKLLINLHYSFSTEQICAGKRK